MKRSIILFALAALIALPTFAAPAPSKAVANQSIDSRTADLAMVRDVVANERVAAVLASHDFTQEQVNQRISQLSNQDLHQLAQNLNQVQAAGLTQHQWILIGIGAVAAIILAIVI